MRCMLSLLPRLSAARCGTLGGAVHGRRRDADDNPRAATCAALDFERAVDVSGALAHRRQPEMTGIRRVGIEANAVIGDFQRDGVIGAPQADAERRGARVLDRVVDALLSNPVERLLRLWRQVRLAAETRLHLQT